MKLIYSSYENKQESNQKNCSEVCLKLVLLFGSQAKGGLHKESDLDLAFYPEKKIDEAELYKEFIQVFKRADIDLINFKENHNHLLRYQILSEGLSLYEAERGLKSRMEWQSYFDYTDFQKYYSQLGQVLNKKLKRLAA